MPGFTGVHVNSPSNKVSIMTKNKSSNGSAVTTTKSGVTPTGKRYFIEKIESQPPNKSKTTSTIVRIKKTPASKITHVKTRIQKDDMNHTAKRQEKEPTKSRIKRHKYRGAKVKK